MNYKLAKQLKNAGFPQKEGLGGYIFEDGHISIFSGFASHAINPTLEDLIDACEDRFHGLIHLPEEWLALSNDVVPMERLGSTAKIAIARLWLALNKK